MEKPLKDNVKSEKSMDVIKDEHAVNIELMVEERRGKREETYKKFQELKAIINENVHIQKEIKKTMKKLRFNNTDINKYNYIYYMIGTIVMLVEAVIIFLYKSTNVNVKFFYLYLILEVIAISCLAFYLCNKIIRNITLKRYLSICKKNYIDSKETTKLVEALLDNSIKIKQIIPEAYFKYFTSEYKKSSVDDFLAFSCRYNKLTLKKYKNRNLSAYKKIFSRNMDVLLDVEEIENNYFFSKLNTIVYDTMEECVEKFLIMRRKVL